MTPEPLPALPIVRDTPIRAVLDGALRPDNDHTAWAGPTADAVKAPRRRLNRWLLQKLIIMGDWFLILGGLAAVIASIWAEPLLDMPLRVALPLLLSGLAVKTGLWAAAVYDLPLSAPAGRRARRVAGGAAIGWSLSILVLSLTLPSGWYVEVLGLVFAGAALMVLGLHALFAQMIRGLAQAGALAETAVIVGATEPASRLIERANRGDELRILGVFEDRRERAPETVGGVPVLGTIDDLFDWQRLPEVDRIIVTVNSAAEARVRAIVERLRILPNRVILLLDLERLALGADQVGALDDSPAALVANQPNDARRAILKRIQDLVLGSLILAAAFLPMLAIAFAVRLDSPGPALFRQQRHGFNNRIITVFKFRSMRQETTDHRAARQVQQDDDRVTKIGRFLRRTSLDELPQLINVLKGEMSLVGPRPHAVGMRTGDVESHLLVAEYAHRHRMKPGMTGWAQINGSRGPLHTPEEVRERIRYDLDYVDRASFWFDLWIILKTAPALLGDKDNIR